MTARCSAATSSPTSACRTPLHQWPRSRRRSTALHTPRSHRSPRTARTGSTSRRRMTLGVFRRRPPSTSRSRETPLRFRPCRSRPFTKGMWSPIPASRLPARKAAPSRSLSTGRPRSSTRQQRPSPPRRSFWWKGTTPSRSSEPDRPVQRRDSFSISSSTPERRNWRSPRQRRGRASAQPPSTFAAQPPMRISKR